MYSLQYIPFHKLYYFNLKVRQCLESGTRNFSFYCPTKIQAQIAKYTVLCVNRDTSTVIGGGPGQNFRVQFSCANLSQCSIPSSKLSCQPILVLFYFPLSGFPSFVLQHLTWQSSWQGEFNCDTPRSHTYHRRANPTESELISSQPLCIPTEGAPKHYSRHHTYRQIPTNSICASEISQKIGRMEYLFYEERMRGLGFSSLEERRLWGDHRAAFKDEKGACKKD